MNFWNFFKSGSPDLEIENAKLLNEVKDLNQVVDELFAKEHEAKAVYHGMSLDYENRIKTLEATISELNDKLDDIKHCDKKKLHHKTQEHSENA